MNELFTPGDGKIRFFSVKYIFQNVFSWKKIVASKEVRG